MKPLRSFIILATVAFPGMALSEEGKDIDSAKIACGYAAAFEQMRRSTATILYKTLDATETIEGVKEITAYGGTLFIKTTSGKEQILDATRVIKIVER